MIPYVGNGAYCYANSISMLLTSIDENIPPSQIEVLTGVGLGAIWMEEEKLVFFGNWGHSVEQGVSQSLELLGFTFITRESTHDDEPPFEELRAALKKGPVVLGPLDMGYLRYNPNWKYLFGSDHYVLAYEMDEREIHLHDPAGFPYVSLSLEHMADAWKAEGIIDVEGAYHYWTAPVRIHRPTAEEIYEKAKERFVVSYRKAFEYAATHNVPFGRDAIRSLSQFVRAGEMSPQTYGHLAYFAFQLGAKRALDYAAFFELYAPDLSKLKCEQAKLFGKCHVLLVKKEWNSLADTLLKLGEAEEEFRRKLCQS